MKERPILMSAPMVRAILAGTKTQTRRIVKLPRDHDLDGVDVNDRASQAVLCSLPHTPTGSRLVRCPYGAPGDRLWVRESFVEWPAGGQLEEPCIPPTTTYEYAADHPGRRGWTPSIHMPRRASRITLEVTGVRVERLQDISEEDARAEGVEPDFGNAYTCAGRDHRRTFERLWDTINGKRAPWESNPWVWVLTFRRVDADRARGAA